MTNGGPPDAGSLAVLVHEVRSPVAALRAVSDAISRGDLAAQERRRLASLAVAACRSIERVVTDHPVGSLLVEDVAVAELVRSVVARAALGGARVRCVLAEGLPRIRGDAVRLGQALGNLVENARVHGLPDGEIVVRAGADGEDVVISVADTGPGVAEEDRSRIFESGVQLLPGARGSGLGLAIAGEIARAHGGTLELETETDTESSPGTGSVFTLRLPRS